MRLFPSVCLLLASVAVPTVAQTHFCIAGDLDHLSATQVSACKAKMTGVREAVRRRGAPSGWHFVVVCDETGWSDFASFSAHETARVKKADFSTDADGHWTFLRGSHMEGEGLEPAGAMLSAALKGVPGKSAPGFEVGPQPIPNPERKRQPPTTQLAEVRPPEQDMAGQ